MQGIGGRVSLRLFQSSKSSNPIQAPTEGDGLSHVSRGGDFFMLTSRSLAPACVPMATGLATIRAQIVFNGISGHDGTAGTPHELSHGHRVLP